MKYNFQIHKSETGYWAECRELDGCATQGETMEELQRNIHEALVGYLGHAVDPARVDLLLNSEQ